MQTDVQGPTHKAELFDQLWEVGRGEQHMPLKLYFGEEKEGIIAVAINGVVGDGSGKRWDVVGTVVGQLPPEWKTEEFHGCLDLAEGTGWIKPGRS